MPDSQSYDHIIELISNGKTEQAIDFLKNVMDNDANLDKELYHIIVLLKTQYRTWKREKSSGVEVNKHELNRINKELLELVTELKRPAPVRPKAVPSATNTAPAHRSPVQKSKNTGSSVGKAIKWMLVGIGALFLIAIILEVIAPGSISGDLPDDPISQDFNPNPRIENHDEQAQSAPIQGFSKTVKEQPDNPTPAEVGMPDEDMDFTTVSSNLFQLSFGNTTWWNANLGHLVFSADGRSATYNNGSGILEVTGYSTNGISANFRETGVDIYGNPVHNNGKVILGNPSGMNTIGAFVYSNVSGQTAYLELIRQ